MSRIVHLNQPSAARAGADKAAEGAVKASVASPDPANAGRRTHEFARRVAEFKHWRDELAKAIGDYRTWMEQQGLADGAEDLRIYELIEGLKSDKLTIALVAEVARGKTELLNAIFFADHGERLLPSAAGRTTMCPTELRYDEKEGPCVKLLPIETRKTALTIAEYKRTPIHWTTIHILKPKSVEEVREACLETTRTKKVDVREAEELGLYDRKRRDGPAPADGMIEIPVWRHAIINYPHPLLKQGLVVLDTPGLNSLGVEPELTLSMLPEAHGVLFVLAADAGVTKTDMEVWTRHVQAAKRGGRFVALNKIDVMWDELQDDAAVARNIARQVDETAMTLHVEKSNIFPVSATKGLVGKAKGDAALLARSGLPALEASLAGDVIPARHAIIRDRIVYDISGRIESSRALLESKLTELERQAEGLRKLGGKNQDAIHKMVAHVRQDRQKYDKELEGFQMTRAALTEQANILFGHMSLKSFDELIAAARRDMQESWTTHGLKAGMVTFFSGAAARMDKVAKQAEQIRLVVERIYRRLHDEYGLAEIRPTALSLAPFFVEFKRLEERANGFRDSPATVMTEQHFVIKKFFVTLASRTRQLFSECNEATKNWFRAIVMPVFAQIQQHKAAIDRNLETLKTIHAGMDDLGERIAKLEEARRDLRAQLDVTERLLEQIHRPLS